MTFEGSLIFSACTSSIQYQYKVKTYFFLIYLFIYFLNSETNFVILYDSIWFPFCLDTFQKNSLTSRDKHELATVKGEMAENTERRTPVSKLDADKHGISRSIKTEPKSEQKTSEKQASNEVLIELASESLDLSRSISSGYVSVDNPHSH